MKKLLLKHIYGIVFLPVILFVGFYFYAYVMDNEFPASKTATNKVHTINQDVVKK